MNNETTTHDTLNGYPKPASHLIHDWLDNCYPHTYGNHSNITNHFEVKYWNLRKCDQVLRLHR